MDEEKNEFYTKYFNGTDPIASPNRNRYFMLRMKGAGDRQRMVLVDTGPKDDEGLQMLNLTYVTAETHVLTLSEFRGMRDAFDLQVYGYDEKKAADAYEIMMKNSMGIMIKKLEQGQLFRMMIDNPEYAEDLFKLNPPKKSLT